MSGWFQPSLWSPSWSSNKNDFIDAEAIAEAVERENMRFVPIKTDDQLDLQAIHRVRDRLISRRTAVINQLRAFQETPISGVLHPRDFPSGGRPHIALGIVRRLGPSPSGR
jgi:transposase